MAVLKFTNSKSSLKKLVRYITLAEKTESKLVSGKDCMPSSAYDEMITVKHMFGKKDGRQYIHLVQSFDVKDRLSYKNAHSIGIALAEKFTGFQVLVATHKDRKHIHNHLLINSVNFKTGLKFQQSKEDMESVKDFSDNLCRDAGLSVIEHRNGMFISQAEYKVTEKGESWKWKLIDAIDNVMEAATSKDKFIQLMQLHGYGVKWMDKRSNITFTTPEGFKCRDNKLHNKKYTKEELENVFIGNGKIKGNEQGRGINTRDGRSIVGINIKAGERRKADSGLNQRGENHSGQRRSSTNDREHNAWADEKHNGKRKRIVYQDERGR